VPVKFEGGEMVYDRILGKERVRVTIVYSDDPEKCSFRIEGPESLEVP
jgi:hypothetical protein